MNYIVFIEKLKFYSLESRMCVDYQGSNPTDGKADVMIVFRTSLYFPCVIPFCKEERCRNGLVVLGRLVRIKWMKKI